MSTPYGRGLCRAGALQPAAVALILGLLIGAGRARAQPAVAPVEVCDVAVTGGLDPIPDGSERGVEIECRGQAHVAFVATTSGGVLHLTLRVMPDTRDELVDDPLDCTVRGRAFVNRVRFQCPGTAAESLVVAPMKCAVAVQYAGSGSQALGFSVKVGGELRSADEAAGTYLLGEGDLYQLAHDEPLRVVVSARDALGSLDAIYTLHAQQCAPSAASRLKIVSLAIERCAAETRDYDLTQVGLRTEDLLPVDYRRVAGSAFAVISSGLPQTGRTPRVVSVENGVVRIAWPANSLCDRGSSSARVRLDLTEIGRAVLLARNGSGQTTAATYVPPPPRPRGHRRAAQTLRLIGEPAAASSLRLLVPGVAAPVAPSADRLFRFAAVAGPPDLFLLARTIGTACELDDGGVHTCPIVERAPSAIAVRFGARPITAPLSTELRMSFDRGLATETLRGAGALAFVEHEDQPGTARERIDAWPETRLPVHLTVPGYLWRTPSGLATTLWLRVDKRALIAQTLAVPAGRGGFTRLRDAVVWALLSHGWRPGPDWLAARGLDRYDPIGRVSATMIELLEGGAAWTGAYESDLAFLSAMAATRAAPASAGDQLLRAHVSAAAALVLARTGKTANATHFRAACDQANLAWTKLSKAGLSAAALDDVRVDLALVRMEACLCSQQMIEHDATVLMADLGAAIDARPDYKEPYLDLKAQLDRAAPAMCKRI